MNLKDQQKLVLIQRKLTSTLQKQPSHKCSCDGCIALTKTLAEVTTLYADILDGVLRAEVRRGFARRLSTLILDVVRVYTKA